MKYLFFLIIIAIGFSCCQVQTKEEEKVLFDKKKEIRDLTNEAARIQMQLGFDDYKDTTMLLKAIALYDSAIVINPKSKAPYTQKSNLLCALGRHREAIDVLEKVIEKYPDFAEGYMSMGFINEVINDSLTASVNYAKAMKLYKMKIDSVPPKAFLYLPNVMLIYLMQGNKDSAILVLDNFPKLDSSSVLVYKQTSNLFENFDKEEFLSNFQKKKP